MKIVVCRAKRSPIGKLLGSLQLSARSLGVNIIKDLMTNLDIKLVSQLILGNVLSANQGQNLARQISLDLGMQNDTIAYTVNQVCGSGMKAIILGCLEILANPDQIIIAGGIEKMTDVPHAINLRKKSFGNQTLTDLIVQDGLTDAFHNIHMGLTAEHLATKYNISRIEQDEFALLSHMKATEAQRSKLFDDEMIKVHNLDYDEAVRSNTSLKSLAELKPVFLENGSVTAGNSSGINDGGAFTLLMSEKQAQKLNLKPLATIVSYAESGLEPLLMGIGPALSSNRALQRAGWTINDLDCIEVNEAFAAQAIAVNKEMGWNTTKINKKGGSIALGHPIGASGARIVTTLLHSEFKKGLASLCIGGGMGIAMCFQK